MPQPSDIQTIGTPFVELQSVDSTNNYARQLIHAGMAQTGMAIFTHEQVAGKGQRGKVWASEKDANIALSIVISPKPLKVTQQFQLSACVAVALHQFFFQYAGDDTKIKSVSYTHLRAHETVLDLVCRLLLEKKKNKRISTLRYNIHLTHTIEKNIDHIL